MHDGGLRPLGVGELLDAGFKIYRKRWRDLMKVVALVGLPLLVLRIVVQLSVVSDQAVSGFTLSPTGSFGSASPTGADVATQLGGTLVLFLLTLVTNALSLGAALRLVTAIYLGEDVTWRESLAYAWHRLGSLLWLTTLVGLATILGLLACVVGIVVPLTMYAAVVPLLMVEGMKGTKAMGRSWRLTKPHFGQTFLTLLVGYLVVQVASTPISLVLVGVLFTSNGNIVLTAVVASLVAFAASVLTTPFTAALHTAIYFDLRVRAEGLDLWLLAQQVGVDVPAGGFPAQPGAPQGMPFFPGGYPPPGGWQQPGGYPPPGGWQQPGAWSQPEPGSAWYGGPPPQPQAWPQQPGWPAAGGPPPQQPYPQQPQAWPQPVPPSASGADAGAAMPAFVPPPPPPPGPPPSPGQSAAAPTAPPDGLPDAPPSSWPPAPDGDA